MPENFEVKFDLHTYARDIYKLLDSVIKNIDDSDLRGSAK
jgi:superfamily II helicase